KSPTAIAFRAYVRAIRDTRSGQPDVCPSRYRLNDGPAGPPKRQFGPWIPTGPLETKSPKATSVGRLGRKLNRQSPRARRTECPSHPSTTQPASAAERLSPLAPLSGSG